MRLPDYWVTFYNRTEYLTHNLCLPELNNEVVTANSSLYASRIASLANIVLSEALNDTVVYPHQSESFGGVSKQGWWGAQAEHPPHSLNPPPPPAPAPAQYEWTNSTFETSPEIVYTFTDAAQSPQWQGDLLSLRTRYETAPSTLLFSTFEGDHIRFR